MERPTESSAASGDTLYLLIDLFARYLKLWPQRRNGSRIQDKLEERMMRLAKRNITTYRM